MPFELSRSKSVAGPERMVADTAGLRRVSFSQPKVSAALLRKDDSRSFTDARSLMRPPQWDESADPRSPSPLTVATRPLPASTVPAFQTNGTTPANDETTEPSSPKSTAFRPPDSFPSQSSFNLAENRLSDFGNRPHDFFETDSSDLNDSESDYADDENTRGRRKRIGNKDNLIRPRRASDSNFFGMATSTNDRNQSIMQDASKEHHAGWSSAPDYPIIDREQPTAVNRWENHSPPFSPTMIRSNHSQFGESQPDTVFMNRGARPDSDQTLFYPYLIPTSGRDDGRRSTQTTVNSISNRSQRSTASQLAKGRLDRLVMAHAITAKAIVNAEAGLEDDAPADSEQLKTYLEAISSPRTKELRGILANKQSSNSGTTDTPAVPPVPGTESDDSRRKSVMKKRVSVVPAPISLPNRRSFSAEVVKTPHPEKGSLERGGLRKPSQPPRMPANPPVSILRNDRTSSREAGEEKTPLSQQSFKIDSTLPLSVRRRYKPHGRCVGKMVIPADPELIRKTTVITRRKSTWAALKLKPAKDDKKEEVKEEEVKVDFDDAALFQKLHDEYRETLLGSRRCSRFWRRYMSLKVLKRIVLVALDGSTSGSSDDVERQPNQGMAGLRSPRVLIRKGLSDTFSEDKLLQHFRSPKLGKGQYAWVHWAHRISQDVEEEYDYDEEVGMVLVPRQTRREFAEPVPGGLEFVEGWSVSRIVLAGLAALAVSALPALIWIFAGPIPADARLPMHEPWTQGLGINDAEGRVGSGMLIALVSAIIGWGTVGVWAIASWLSM